MELFYRLTMSVVTTRGIPRIELPGHKRGTSSMRAMVVLPTNAADHAIETQCALADRSGECHNGLLHVCVGLNVSSRDSSAAFPALA